MNMKTMVQTTDAEPDNASEHLAMPSSKRAGKGSNENFGTSAKRVSKAQEKQMKIKSMDRAL